jgi:hypothetical protein
MEVGQSPNWGSSAKEKIFFVLIISFFVNCYSLCVLKQYCRIKFKFIESYILVSETVQSVPYIQAHRIFKLFG